jgi:ankyrin repeat protein
MEIHISSRVPSVSFCFVLFLFLMQEGWTCLHAAAWFGHHETAALLLTAGADLFLTDSEVCSKISTADDRAL